MMDFEEVKDPNDQFPYKKKKDWIKLMNYDLNENIDQNCIKINIRNLKNQNEFSFLISSLDIKIGRIKNEIKKITMIPKRHQRLFFLGNVLDFSNLTLEDYKIGKDSTIQLFPIPNYGNNKNNSECDEAKDKINRSKKNKICTKCKQDFKLLDIDSKKRDKNHYDYELDENIIDNKLWCFLLLLASVLNLSNDISFYFFEGHRKSPCLQFNFDCFLFIYNIICSLFGFILSIKGLKILKSIGERE